MTNLELDLVIKEIGKIRTVKRVKLIDFDAWFLYNIKERIDNAYALTSGQQKYMLLILHKLKENTYKEELANDYSNRNKNRNRRLH